MEENMAELADWLGIARHFTDSGINKKDYDIDEKVIHFFTKLFGYSAETPQDASESLNKLKDKYFKEALDPIYVLQSNNLTFDFRFKKTTTEKPLSLTLQDEDTGNVLSAEIRLSDIREERLVGRTTYQSRALTIISPVPLGYYTLTLTDGKNTWRTRLACVPEKCYTDQNVESGRLWGYSLQLYSLKSKRNWGIGDLTDLKTFVGLCARAGADIIGLNPLNVLFHDFPENASPYSSISRLFLNPIYIDPTAVRGFEDLNLPDLDQQISEIKSKELIDYTSVYNLKLNVLHQIFIQHKMTKIEQKEFDAFKKEKGSDLELLATYQALYSEQSKHVWGGWRAWDKALQNPNTSAVAHFRQAHTAEIEFFKFLQFETDRQFKAVADEVRRLGLKIGLYRDLPVGVCKDSAELWADRYVFMEKVGAGAPPDAFFPCGQKWCLGAFNPIELKARAYEPYLKILRANMAYAGALRIDHVMGLMRLFLIPDEGEGGTYIKYNFEDMLGLLALESHRHRCVVVGESIGNVPDGFLDALRRHNIYAISVLWSERWNGDGDFKRPADYPSDAFVSVGTHDMPPLKMWWFGYEIELMNRLKMLTDNERQNAYHRREADRQKLLSALDQSGVWPSDRPRRSNYPFGEGYPEGIEESAHRFLARSSSKVVMIQPEDIFQVSALQNLPGTDREQYPNWRHRLPIDLEDMKQTEAYQRHIRIFKDDRA